MEVIAKLNKNQLILLNLKTKRYKSNYPTAIWKENPEDYVYVRESSYFCGAKNYKPGKSKNIKLIGYTIPEKIGEYYKGTFWWLKDYDVGMPNEMEVYAGPNAIGLPSESIRFVSGVDE